MLFSSFIKSAVLAGTVILSAQAFAIEAFYSTKEGAIQGYDPVAYFTENKAVKGSKNFSTKWQGTEWHFSSKANLDAFNANPEKYAPQYGGYCAYGVAQGYAPAIDPQAFAVRDGKLYLNYNKDVMNRWNQNIPGYIADANQNWPKIKVSADGKK
jgi:YHS domain-containing protein